MKTKQAVILFLTMLALPLAAAQSTNLLRFPVSGFSIAPLEVLPGDITRQALIMFLPPNGNFSGNVNVQVQPYSGTIQEYMTLTLSQFKDVGARIIEQKQVGQSAIVFEYAGELQGQPLHWYARAEKSAGHVYLATATATQQQWENQSPQLKACVDSLRCESNEHQVASPNPPPRSTPQTQRTNNVGEEK